MDHLLSAERQYQYWRENERGKPSENEEKRKKEEEVIRDDFMLPPPALSLDESTKHHDRYFGPMAPPSCSWENCTVATLQEKRNVIIKVIAKRAIWKQLKEIRSANPNMKTYIVE